MPAIVILTDSTHIEQKLTPEPQPETTQLAVPPEPKSGGDWRHPSGDEAERGAEVRRALADLWLYPTRDLGLDPGFAMLEVNQRAALAEMVAALDRTDLAALYHLVRLLVLAERDEGVFEYVRVLDAAARAPVVEGVAQ